VSVDASYRDEIERWHAGRITRLTAPDGWLSLVGLEWLRPGANTIGSAVGNDIVIANAPAHLGAVEWAQDGTLTVILDPASGATIDGKPGLRAPLIDDSHPKPTVVAFGTLSFVAIDRSGRKGLRVRDSAARTRTDFRGIERFPIDPAWRVEADWQQLDPPFQLATSTVIGTIENYPAPGMATFHRDGKRLTLYPVLETPDATRLFVFFADLTSGAETHGAARFLYADMPEGNRIVLDFNQAYNPPCAFTPHATCPLAPPENRLGIRVLAGERQPAGC
jgi:uncharacterized protein (DUF1684 family)